MTATRAIVFRCIARYCQTLLDRSDSLCARHASMCPTNIRLAFTRATQRHTPLQQYRLAKAAAIGVIAMREDRAITAEERSAINAFAMCD